MLKCTMLYVHVKSKIHFTVTEPLWEPLRDDVRTNHQFAFDPPAVTQRRRGPGACTDKPKPTRLLY